MFTGICGICWELYNHKVGGTLKQFVEFCCMEETGLPLKARLCSLQGKTVLSEDRLRHLSVPQSSV